MDSKSVVIAGFPESGKTTFLAALWHLIFEGDVQTKLKFHSLDVGNTSHLEEIANRWRSCLVQDRTKLGGNRLVSMNLINEDGQPVKVAFPDLAGEGYSELWELRECPMDLVDIYRAGGVMLFIHADGIRHPIWLTEAAAIASAIGDELQAGREVPWSPELAPTQVQVVGALQLFRESPLDIGPRRLVLMLSAWDKVKNQGKSPLAFLEQQLPLLYQYLHQNADGWEWKVYGLSAQGGDYDSLENQDAPSDEANRLREMSRPTERICLVDGESEGHDITEPLAWLVG